MAYARWCRNTLPMGQYLRGDVVLAPLSLDDWSAVKSRPAVVIGSCENGEVFVCPVSSRPPSDAPVIPISLDDFADGGLDLFSESYVLTTRTRTIRRGEVIGRKGRLTQECMAAITAQMPEADRNNNRRKTGPG